ncbi:hypothetical protein [Rhizobium sp. WYJ-E13]|jgi:hypothetical protein|uniref:hypothetical protein n=1 Tax=unclassified Rhizobium TaxID=2613769 RepID=UPI001C1EA1B7|nr:hypothetical protein [Rhizobium sp. WYJ-E13]QWW68812.1 hypothetical protein KQ933_03630 [Rhizobium sp. WYJ-E13]
MGNRQRFIKPEAGSPADTGNQDSHGKEPGKPPILNPEAGSGGKQPIPLINPSGGGAVTR